MAMLQIFALASLQALLASFAVLLFKRAAVGVPARELYLVCQDWRLYLGLALYGAAFVPMLLLVKQAHISVAVPIAMCCGLVASSIIGVFMNGEKIGLSAILGFGCIAVGAMLVAAGRADP